MNAWLSLGVLLVSTVLLASAGCVGHPDQHPQEILALRSHTDLVVRQAEAEAARFRQQLAALTSASAKKDAELEDVRGLVMRLQRDQAESDRVRLHLKQALDGKEEENARLQEQQTSHAMAAMTVRQHDQEESTLQEKIRTLTVELERVKQSMAHLSARVSEHEERSDSRTPWLQRRSRRHQKPIGSLR